VLLKVINGTTKGDTVSLCYTCRNATVIKGPTNEIIDCSQLSEHLAKELRRIQPIHHCNYYDNKATPSLQHMNTIAWELLPDKKTGRIGFAPPKGKRDANVYNPVTGKQEWI
jgi:hypothetical protein